MTLKQYDQQDDLVKLCEILEKAIEDAPQGHLDFTLSGKSESMSFKSIEDLRNARLPEEVREIRLIANDWKRDRAIRLYLENGLSSYNSIEITDWDADWVAARSKEIEDFMSDHHNFHWIVNGNWLPMLEGVFFAGLVMYTVAIYAKLLWDNTAFIAAVIFSAAFLAPAYMLGIGKLFPFTFIDTGRSSIMTTFRTAIKWAVPIIIVSLIVQLILRGFFA